MTALPIETRVVSSNDLRPCTFFLVLLHGKHELKIVIRAFHCLLRCHTLLTQGHGASPSSLLTAMAPRSYSPLVTFPFRLCFQLLVVTFVVSNILAALPHNIHAPPTYSTELNALDSAEATLPQYNSITKSKWLSNDEEKDDDDDDLETLVSAQLQPLEDIVPRKHSTFKLAVLLPYNMTRRNYVFREDAMLSVTSVSVAILIAHSKQGSIVLSIMKNKSVHPRFVFYLYHCIGCVQRRSVWLSRTST